MQGDIQIYIGAGVLLVAAANFVFTIYTFRAGAKRDAVEKLETRLNQIAGDAKAGDTATVADIGKKLGELTGHAEAGDAAIAATVEDFKTEWREGIAERNAKISAMQDRLTRVEGEIGHLPTKDQVNALTLAISDLSGDVRTLSAELAAVKATAGRVENFLLEHGGR
jgi:hypothetical protein